MPPAVYSNERRKVWTRVRKVEMVEGSEERAALTVERPEKIIGWSDSSILERWEERDSRIVEGSIVVVLNVCATS